MQVPRGGERRERSARRLAGGKKKVDMVMKSCSLLLLSSLLSLVAFLPFLVRRACVPYKPPSTPTPNTPPPKLSRQRHLYFQIQATVRRRSTLQPSSVLPRLSHLASSEQVVHIDQNQRHMQLDKGREREKLVAAFNTWYSPNRKLLVW